MSVRLIVAVTDGDWFDQLRQMPDLQEVAASRRVQGRAVRSRSTRRHTGTSKIVVLDLRRLSVWTTNRRLFAAKLTVLVMPFDELRVSSSFAIFVENRKEPAGVW